MFDFLVDLVKEINHTPSEEITVKWQTQAQVRAEERLREGLMMAEAEDRIYAETDPVKRQRMLNLYGNGIYNFDKYL